MNALEIYRKLPKKNCGLCMQKSCLPFALSLIKGEAELTECPHLTEAEADGLKKIIVHSDWREELIQRLKEQVKDSDFREVASHIGAELVDNTLLLRCMGREFTVSASGEISSRGIITPWMKILLLHYIKTGGRRELADKWVSFSELKGGMVKASSFTRDCEEPLRELFDQHPSEVSSVLERFGAGLRDDFPTPNTWLIRLLPKIPVVILFWPADTEFPSKLKILLDSTADQFLDVESIMFLVEGLVNNVQATLTRPA